MTNKELKKLKRADLLEILYYLQKEIEELNRENAMLKNQLENTKFELSDDDLKRIVEVVKYASKDSMNDSADMNEADEEQDISQSDADNKQ